MAQLLVSGFMQCFPLAVVALLVGRYVGRRPKLLPILAGSKVLLFIKVWLVVFLAQMTAFYAMGYLGIFSDDTAWLAYLLPIVLGAAYAHMQLLRPQV